MSVLSSSYMLKATTCLCQHLQLNWKHKHAWSIHTIANMPTQKGPHEVGPTTCEGTRVCVREHTHVHTHAHAHTHTHTHTHIHTHTHTLPFFAFSFPLSSWEPSTRTFASKPNTDQIPKSPIRPPPHPLDIRPSFPSHFLTFSLPLHFGLCLNKGENEMLFWVKWNAVLTSELRWEKAEEEAERKWFATFPFFQLWWCWTGVSMDKLHNLNCLWSVRSSHWNSTYSWKWIHYHPDASDHFWCLWQIL